ncbi:hypothetical protein [Bartonella sp. OT172YNZD]|uniref:hypothetical protein n=1 Tax=Bartonella sp. OT172YNZD TaxID=3243572 RepID=UPI0035CFBD11
MVVVLKYLSVWRPFGACRWSCPWAGYRGVRLLEFRLSFFDAAFLAWSFVFLMRVQSNRLLRGRFFARGGAFLHYGSCPLFFGVGEDS